MTAPAAPASDDPYNLARFLSAHDGDYERACAELKAGRKQTHWIWFIFPQLKGLGRSHTAAFYGITSLAEAKAYLAHPVLRARLEEATRLVLAHPNATLMGILGTPDDLKFASSMTLFAEAAGPGSVFAEALAGMCDGKRCGRTLDMLGKC